MTRKSTALLSFCILIVLVLGLSISPVSGRGMVMGAVNTTPSVSSTPFPEETEPGSVATATTVAPVVTTQTTIAITQTVPPTVQTSVVTTAPVPPQAPVQTTTTSPVPVEIVIIGIGAALLLAARTRQK